MKTKKKLICEKCGKKIVGKEKCYLDDMRVCWDCFDDAKTQI
jgi:formylmethanofuran dehydrogenase subunit E